MTPTEQLLWTKLRARQCHSFKFRRQHAMIVDFFWEQLLVEIDGVERRNEQKT